MNETKTSDLNEWIKSALVVLFPVLVLRAILESSHVSALIQGLVMMALITISDLIRKQIKNKDNNELYVFLIFILFFPAGFYYLWRYSKKGVAIKIVISAVFIILLVVAKNVIGTLQ